MFTDALGNPIQEGDQIIYPVCSGSSSATLAFGVVKLVDPLVDDVKVPYDGAPPVDVVVRESHRRRGNRAEFNLKKNWRTGQMTPDKDYVLVVKQAHDWFDNRPLTDEEIEAARPKTIRNVEQVVVISRLV